MANYDPLVLKALGLGSLPQNPQDVWKASLNGATPQSGEYDTWSHAQQFSNPTLFSNWNTLQNSYNPTASFLGQQKSSNPLGYSAFASSPFTLPSSLNGYSLPQPTQAVAQKAVSTSHGTPVTGKGSPFPTGDPNAMLGELRKVFGSLDGLFNTDDLKSAVHGRMDIDTALGLQAATAAGREGANTAYQSGGSVNSNLLRAQALLPVLQHVSGLETSLQDKVLETQQNQASVSGQLAQALGSLRTQYVNSLADYTTKLSSVESEDLYRTNSLAEQARQFNLGYGLDAAKFGFAQNQAQANALSNMPYSNDYDPYSFGNQSGRNARDPQYSAAARNKMIAQLLGVGGF